MLKSNSKVYLVTEYGGEYEDKWEHTIGVCSSLDLAQELKAEVEESHRIECSIPEEKYFEMCDYLYEYEEEHGEICEEEIEGLLKLFPEYSEEELRKADRKYCSYDDYSGVDIQELDLYN